MCTLYVQRHTTKTWLAGTPRTSWRWLQLWHDESRWWVSPNTNAYYHWPLSLFQTSISALPVALTLSALESAFASVLISPELTKNLQIIWSSGENCKEKFPVHSVVTLTFAQLQRCANEVQHLGSALNLWESTRSLDTALKHVSNHLEKRKKVTKVMKNAMVHLESDSSSSKKNIFTLLFEVQIAVAKYIKAHEDFPEYSDKEAVMAWHRFNADIAVWLLPRSVTLELITL